MGTCIKNHKAFIRYIMAAVALGVFLWGAVAGAQGFARGYHTDDQELQSGMVVVLKATGTADKPQVERASRENIDRVIGVATEIEDNLVTVVSGEPEIYVQNSGVVEAFVSDMNGVVKKGDTLALSPLKGILMRGDETLPVVGKALEDSTPGSAGAQTVAAGNGQMAANVAKITILLDSSLVTYPESELSESALQRLGRTLTGREVSEMQVVVALIIFFIVLVSESSIIYGAVSSGIISIGRNPMARRAIKGEMLRVFGIAAFVLLVGLAAIYIVLRI